MNVTVYRVAENVQDVEVITAETKLGVAAPGPAYQPVEAAIVAVGAATVKVEGKVTVTESSAAVAAPTVPVPAKFALP